MPFSWAETNLNKDPQLLCNSPKSLWIDPWVVRASPDTSIPSCQEEAKLDCELCLWSSNKWKATGNSPDKKNMCCMCSNFQTFQRSPAVSGQVLRPLKRLLVWSENYALPSVPPNWPCPTYVLHPCTQHASPAPSTKEASRKLQIPGETWPLCKASRKNKRSNETGSAGSSRGDPGVKS